MFSIECNFIIAFLVVFLKIDQGIYCGDSNDYFSLNKQRPSFLPRQSTTYFAKNLSALPTTSVSRDNTIDRSQLPRQLFSLGSLSRNNVSSFKGLFNSKKYELIMSNNDYKKFIQQNDYVIIYFSSKYNIQESNTANYVMSKLMTEKKYKDKFKIYEMIIEDNIITAKDWFVESTPSILLYRNGYNIYRMEGMKVLNEIEFRKLFEKFLQIDDKANEEPESKTKTYYSGQYKYTGDREKICMREKVSSTKNGNKSNELTEPKKDEFIYKITSLKQYEKYSQGIDYSIIFFSSQHNMEVKENSDAIKYILNTLSKKSVYEKIKIFNVDMKDCKNVADKYEIASTPSLVSFCMENVIGKLVPNDFLDGRNTNEKIELFFNSLLESKVQDNWSKMPRMSENIYNITSLEQYENYCKTTDYAIIFFTSSEEAEACEEVKKILNKYIVLPTYSKIRIYGMDVKNNDLSQYFKVSSAPSLFSLCQNSLIYNLGPSYASQETFVLSLLTNLISASPPDKAIKYSICGDCAPKIVRASSTNQADTNKAYNRSNLPPLKSEEILLKVTTKEDYDAYVLKTELAVIDFSSTNCTGCTKTYSILKKLMEGVQTNQEIILYSVDIQECNKVAQLYGISSAPTLVFLHMGKQIKKFGAKESQNESDIQNMFDKLLKLKTPT